MYFNDFTLLILHGISSSEEYALVTSQGKSFSDCKEYTLVTLQGIRSSDIARNELR